MLQKAPLNQASLARHYQQEQEVPQLKRIYQKETRFTTLEYFVLSVTVLASCLVLVVNEQSLGLLAGSLFGIALPLHLHSRNHSVELMHLGLVCWLTVDTRGLALFLAMLLLAALICRLSLDQPRPQDCEYVELPMRVANVNFPCFI